MFQLIPDPRSRVDLDNFVRFFETLGFRIGQGEKAEIHEAVISGFQANFRGEHSAGGQWAGLAAATQRERAISGFSAAHPILYRTGDFYNSLVDPSDSNHYEQSYQSSNLLAMDVGSESPLLGFHESGTKNMPARPVTDLTDQSEQHIGNVIDGLMARLLQREGL